jgi:KaiC/GvpD/RAD55 family RecA-like ATPase
MSKNRYSTRFNFDIYFCVLEAKEQVLANLANFAYDPINYDFLRKLKVIDIFLDNLSESNIKLQEFAVAGLCNLCLGEMFLCYC